MIIIVSIVLRCNSAILLWLVRFPDWQECHFQSGLRNLTIFWRIIGQRALDGADKEILFYSHFLHSGQILSEKWRQVWQAAEKWIHCEKRGQNAVTQLPDFSLVNKKGQCSYFSFVKKDNVWILLGTIFPHS